MEVEHDDGCGEREEEMTDEKPETGSKNSHANRHKIMKKIRLN